MGGKPYKDWGEVKKEIKYWNGANKTCLVIGLLFILAGVVTEAFNYDFILAPTSWFLLAVFFAVASIAPHISFIALKSWYGVESERKNK
jgi:hypothetical protein